MPTTPNIGLPYPAATDAPDLPGAMYALVSLLDARDSNWVTYNAGFNFSGGTGSSGFFQWRRENASIHLHGRIVLGTSPAINASTITFGLPTPASAMRGIPYATRIVYGDNSAGSNGFFLGEVRIIDQNTAQLYVINAAGTNGQLQPANATAPFVWSDGDYLDIDFGYLVD